MFDLYLNKCCRMKTLSTTRSLIRWRRELIIDVYELVVGFFLFLSPWLFSYTRSIGKFDAWAGGITVILVSLAALRAFSEWEEWLNLVLGLWLIAAPWILGFTHTTGMHISIIVGGIVAYLAVLDIWTLHYMRETDSHDRAP